MLKNIENETKGTTLTGSILVRTCEVKKTKTGNDYIAGEYLANGKHGYKIWGGIFCETVKSMDVVGKVTTITGTVDEYNGVKSLIIDNLVIEENANVLDFYDTPYNEEYIQNFYNLIKSKLSDEGKEILDLVMKDHYQDFQNEFAAISHHDAVPMGLIAHSLKVARLILVITNLYPIIMRQTDKDFYILAALLHDIGKIKEYNKGVFNEENGWLTHRYFGIEIISGYKKEIVAIKGERWYNRLLSVIMQHHGEWGERPQTMEAYVVHLVDHLEAQMTDISEAMVDKDKKELRYNGYRLRL